MCITLNYPIKSLFILDLLTHQLFCMLWYISLEVIFNRTTMLDMVIYPGVHTTYAFPLNCPDIMGSSLFCYVEIVANRQVQHSSIHENYKMVIGTTCLLIKCFLKNTIVFLDYLNLSKPRAGLSGSLNHTMRSISFA